MSNQVRFFVLTLISSAFSFWAGMATAADCTMTINGHKFECLRASTEITDFVRKLEEEKQPVNAEIKIEQASPGDVARVIKQLPAASK